ncbi:MAG: DUF2213 domain-containing protein [Lachnospiraceae bacterium]|nr:DUF2213 domain-containing protein [Lachnospiraceae bacterium]
MKQQNAPPKLKRVRRLDSIRLDADDRTYFTEEGYLVDHPVLTSVGIFEYTNPDGTIRRELRLPEHVFAEKSLKTYRGKPVIITHSAGKISKNNVDREQIGTILSDGYQDNDDVRAEIIIHNTDAMKSSGLKELSLGYNLDLIEEPGEWNGHCRRKGLQSEGCGLSETADGRRNPARHENGRRRQRREHGVQGETEDD